MHVSLSLWLWEFQNHRKKCLVNSFAYQYPECLSSSLLFNRSQLVSELWEQTEPFWHASLCVYWVLFLHQVHNENSKFDHCCEFFIDLTFFYLHFLYNFLLTLPMKHFYCDKILISGYRTNYLECKLTWITCDSEHK